MRIGQLLERSACFHSSSEAIDDGARRVTYGALLDEVRSMAVALHALGVQSCDRVAILARNRIEYVAFYFAVAEVGAVAVPLNWRLRAPELDHILRDAYVRLVVAEADFAATLDELAASASIGPSRELSGPLAGWIGAPGLEPTGGDAQPGAPDETAIQMYTSGTTGAPKGALLTHQNLVSMTTAWLLDMPLVPRRDRFLQVTPLFHVGAVLMVLSNVAVGSRLLLMPEFSPGGAAEALTARGVTKALFVPSMIRWILQEPDLRTHSFADLELIAYGASPIAEPLLLDAMTTFGCDFVQGYGLTESAGVLTSLRPEDHFDASGTPARLASAGRAVLCSQVAVVDDHDQPLPTGERGELVARGTNVTPGYWNRPDETRDALRGGWFHTGDVATIDAYGFVTIVDRVKDMILVGGENVYPREVEIALESHPDVVEAAVIGVPHDLWGEAVLAVVVPRPGASLTDRHLIGHARTRLARFKCPTRVEFVEVLPRNAAGKLLKLELRAPFWAGCERQV